MKVVRTLRLKDPPSTIICPNTPSTIFETCFGSVEPCMPSGRSELHVFTKNPVLCGLDVNGNM